MGKVPESSKWNKWTIFSDDALDSKKNLLFNDETNHYVYSWKSID